VKEQTYILKNFSEFEPKHIFECGQCFRWNKEEDGSYTGIFNENVLNVKKENGQIIFKGICKQDIKKVCIKYFDLERDYKKIKRKITIDEYMREAIAYGSGIRILNQDLWEVIISFIISANNNIPRIKGIIERLSKAYGKPIKYNGKTYYTFPTKDELFNVTIEDYRKLGLGFRDKYIYKTVHTIDLETINTKEDLLKLSGVGEKVADCIMLFGMNKFEVFPVDVWVRRVMNDLYIKSENEEKVNKEEIRKLAKEKYNDLCGIAQQYLFYWKREA